MHNLPSVNAKSQDDRNLKCRIWVQISPHSSSPLFPLLRAVEYIKSQVLDDKLSDLCNFICCACRWISDEDGLRVNLRFTYVKAVEGKSNTTEIIIEFLAVIENKFIEVLRIAVEAKTTESEFSIKF